MVVLKLILEIKEKKIGNEGGHESKKEQPQGF